MHTSRREKQVIRFLNDFTTHSDRNQDRRLQAQFSKGSSRTCPLYVTKWQIKVAVLSKGHTSRFQYYVMLARKDHQLLNMGANSKTSLHFTSQKPIHSWFRCAVKKVCCKGFAEIVTYPKSYIYLHFVNFHFKDFQAKII